jgi:thioredoxin 1
MAITVVNKDNFEEEVLRSPKKVLVDFYADWCGPCKMISPIVEQIAEENEDIKVCKINVDSEPELSIKYQVMSIPTLISFQNGEVSDKSIGLVGKEEILNIIK